MGTDGLRYDIQRWVPMAVDTIEEMGSDVTRKIYRGGSDGRR